jgi:hypothetical protein
MFVPVVAMVNSRGRHQSAANKRLRERVRDVRVDIGADVVQR